jgi:hypothetical protein
MQNFTQLSGRAHSSRSFIWSPVSGLMYSKARIKFRTNLGKSAIKILAMIRHAFGEENMSHTRAFEWQV